MCRKICEYCGKEFEVIPSRMKKARFCSRKCTDKWRSENIRGEKHRQWRGGKITKRCKQCNIEYEIKRSHYDKRHFCSRECYAKWRKENWRYENSPAWKGGKNVKICKQCGEAFEDYPACEHQFCSRECYDKWHPGKNSPGWRGGVSFEPYCHKFNEKFKESIREKFGRVCFLCPTTEEENGRRLSVHHVDYNKDCLCDDSGCEFVPLCIPCHSKTNHDHDCWEKIIMDKLAALQ